jgi:hypothetical protein
MCVHGARSVQASAICRLLIGVASLTTVANDERDEIEHEKLINDDCVTQGLIYIYCYLISKHRHRRIKTTWCVNARLTRTPLLLVGVGKRRTSETPKHPFDLDQTRHLKEIRFQGGKKPAAFHNGLRKSDTKPSV